MSKRTVTLAVALPALVLLVVSSLPWASGRSDDPVLGQRLVTATGGQAAPGAAALAVVALAGLVVLLTGGRRARRAAGLLVVASGLGAAVFVVAVLRDPAAVVGRRAAEELGRIGSVATDASVTAWVWVALIAAALLAVAGWLAGSAAAAWSGLSARFERPEGGEAGGSPPARTAWEALSAGDDPTRDPADDGT